MITSQRTFGIEIEMGAPSREVTHQLQNEIQHAGWRFDDDGSIRHVVPNPIEIVSPVLTGTAGEAMVRDVCSRIKRLGFNADYIQCGLHVHLGAEEFRKGDSFIALDKQQFTEFMASGNRKHMRSVFYLTEDAVKLMDGSGSNISNARYRSIGKDFLKRTGDGFFGFTNGGKRTIVVRNDVVKVGKEAVRMRVMDGVLTTSYKEIKQAYEKRVKSINQTISKLQQRRGMTTSDNDYRIIRDQERVYHDKIEQLYDEIRCKQEALADLSKTGRYIVWVEDKSYVERLIALLLFYVTFDNVFMGMLPDSRRKGNMYCIPVSKTFTPEQILKVKTLEDFECLWYKDPRRNGINYHKNEHYDDSRYHNVNFHSLWNRHGTIEIRSHSSTTNPSKILLWTALHQAVVDKVSSGAITKNTLAQYQDLSLEEKATAMIAVLELPMYMQKYVKRMLNYFSNTNL